MNDRRREIPGSKTLHIGKEQNMKKISGVSVFVLLWIFAGCATVPPKRWVSNPPVQMSENQYYQAQLEPLKKGHDFFTLFLLTVVNNTDKNLEIDWNYLMNIPIKISVPEE